MKTQHCPTYAISIFMAGDIELAKNVIQRHVINVGVCVTVTPTTYVYSGGREEGFIVGLINYPRFPVDDFGEIDEKAHVIANALLVELGQHSYSIMTPEKTVWKTRRPGGGAA